jgi:hypothetical protein
MMNRYDQNAMASVSVLMPNRMKDKAVKKAKAQKLTLAAYIRVLISKDADDIATNADL